MGRMTRSRTVRGVRALVSWLFWFALIGICFSAGASAAPLRLEDGNGAYYIAKDVEMLTDPTSSMTIDQVAASNEFGKFGLMPNRHAAYWLRVDYDHSASKDDWYLFLGYKPDIVDMYVPKPGGYDVQHSGILTPYAERPVRAYGVVSFILPPSARTVYVRIKTVEPDLTVAVDPSGLFWKVNEINLLIIVAVDAVLAALLIGTVALFFMSRNSIFWLYGAYLLAELLYRSNSAGMVSAFLWQHLSFSPEQFGVVFDAIRIVALTMMLRFFLNLRRHSLLMDRLNLMLIAIAVIYGLLSLFGYPELTMARQFAIVYVPIWLISAIVAWRKGEPQAPLVVVAWAFFMIGSYAFALKQLFGLGRGNLTTELLISHGTDIGITLQGLFLSLALSTELQQLSKAKDRFEKLSVHDALTGVGNRRLMESALEREWMRAIRGRKPIGLLVTDIDNFKGFNDRYGHAAGDVALIDVAKCGESAMRGGDLFCRYGGEEFVAILPEADAAGAMAVATRLRQAVNEARIASEKSPTGFLTVSVGVVSMIPDASWPSSTLFERADQALYRAKESGRNRVEMSCISE
jgi:diguanylate cyclase (GGDEF)-like protein